MEFVYEDVIIDYDVYGKGPPVILLHGWGGDKKSLSMLVPYLKNYCVYSLSLPQNLNKAWTVKKYSALVAEFLLRNNIFNPNVICHSFGGRIVIELAKLFNNIVFIDSAGLKPRLSLKKKVKIFEYKWTKFLVKKGIKKQSALDKFGSSDYKNLSGAMKQTFVNIVNYYQDKMLPMINNNTLIIWGKYDKDTPLYMAKKLHRKIKNSQLNVFDGGHFCYLNHIESIGILIQNFFDS